MCVYCATLLFFVIFRLDLSVNKIIIQLNYDVIGLNQIFIPIFKFLNLLEQGINLILQQNVTLYI